MASRTRDLFFSRTYDWLESYLPRQAGRSDATVESYRDALTMFRRYVRDVLRRGIGEFSFGECDRDCVLGWVEHMRAEGLAAGTCNQRVAAVKSYLNYAADADVALTSLALSVGRIPPVKGPQRVKENLSEAALKAILSAPDPRTKLGQRDLAMLCLLYDTGMRLSELTGLTVGNTLVEHESPHVYVVGKGDKERPIGLSDETVAQVRRHMSVSHGPNPDKSDYLFYAWHGGTRNRMCSSNVQRIVKKYADEARKNCPEVPDPCYPHMWRRTRATDLYQQGTELALVSRILGHASMETTKVYAKPSMEMMREAMNSASNGIGAGEQASWEADEDLMARLCGLR
jgi:site-specific recombinase XerD